MTSSPTTAPQPGDIKKGYVFTEQGTWAPVKPPKKKHTVRNVFLILILAPGVLGMGGCTALVGGAANEVGKSIEQDANKPGRHRQPADHHRGQGLRGRRLRLRGWLAIGKDGLGDMDVKGLKVTNNRDSKDSALVEIKVWRGTEVLALADCTTEPIDVGTTVSLSCLSADALPEEVRQGHDQRHVLRSQGYEQPPGCKAREPTHSSTHPLAPGVMPPDGWHEAALTNKGHPSMKKFLLAGTALVAVGAPVALVAAPANLPATLLASRVRSSARFASA